MAQKVKRHKGIIQKPNKSVPQDLKEFMEDMRKSGHLKGNPDSKAKTPMFPFGSNEPLPHGYEIENVKKNSALGDLAVKRFHLDYK